MISLKHINKTYDMGTRKVHALSDVTLEIGAGEMVACMGASGSGKSTLLNIVGLLDAPDSGSYVFDKESVAEISQNRSAFLRNHSIGFVFQAFNLLPQKTALENVALPLYYQSVPRKERLSRAHDVLAQLGLDEWAEHKPSELSGGQQQRVAIARALITTPKLLLADEPTGALDTTTSTQVMEVLKEVNAKGITVVVVTHDPDIAAIAERTIRMRDGAIQF